MNDILVFIQTYIILVEFSLEWHCLFVFIKANTSIVFAKKTAMKQMHYLRSLVILVSQKIEKSEP